MVGKRLLLTKRAEIQSFFSFRYNKCYPKSYQLTYAI